MANGIKRQWVRRQPLSTEYRAYASGALRLFMASATKLMCWEGPATPPPPPPRYAR